MKINNKFKIKIISFFLIIIISFFLFNILISKHNDKKEIWTEWKINNGQLYIIHYMKPKLI